MKSKSILLTVVVVILCSCLTNVSADIHFKDGGIHDINYPIGDGIRVDYGQPGVGTCINWFDGASTSHYMRLYEDSKLNVFGGSISNLLNINGRARVNIFEGAIGPFDCFDSSQVLIYGGSIATINAADSSQLIFSGGTVSGGIDAGNYARIIINGGVVGWRLRSFERAIIEVSGGSFQDEFQVNLDSTFIIYGQDFAVDGQAVPYGEITSIYGGWYFFEPVRYLSGTLINGDSINRNFRIGQNAKIILAPEPPPTPPVADADGPYTIFVGDTLTLDANDSTDDDNDIVSFLWDLDDDGIFETDAGAQPVFDVNFAYLQSLGLLIDHTYNIHLKVTDSEDQNDIADSTLTILPKPAVNVAVDIKPGSCPNPVNVKNSGVLPVAILGTADYDVTTIDPTSIRLAGVAPLRSSFEDVAAPVSDSNDCNCTTDGPDGFLDLTLKFKTQRIVEAVGDVNDGDVRVLTLTGVLLDPPPYETPIEGADCVLIRGKHKPINPADINKDGLVNILDFAVFAENWLQSSIVED